MVLIGILSSELGPQLGCYSYRAKLRTYHVPETTAKLLDSHPIQYGLIGCIAFERYWGRANTV